MGMQVSCGLDSEMPEEGAIWATSKRTGPRSSEVGVAERERSGRREAESGSCSRGAFDSAEVLGIASGWVYEGQECDLGCKDNREESQFCGSELLGPRLLCLNGWSGRRGHPGICPQPGRG